MKATDHVDISFPGCQPNLGIENGATPNGQTTASSLYGCKGTNGEKEIFFPVHVSHLKEVHLKKYLSETL